MSLEGAIAVHRFGLGSRPGEIEAASSDPKEWLMAQIGSGGEQPAAPDGSAFPGSGILVRQEQEMIAARRAVWPLSMRQSAPCVPPWAPMSGTRPRW
jgi:uncharacterized protein (DUF1800 family)